MLGFENHLNVFHANKHGFCENLAYGLATFLNSTIIDENFRRFNGHTQVNAADLRSLEYPTRDVLITLGHWAKAQDELSQALIDDRVETLL